MGCANFEYFFELIFMKKFNKKNLRLPLKLFLYFLLPLFNTTFFLTYYNIDDLDELDDLLKDVVVDYSESTQDEIDKLLYDDI